MFGVDLGTHVCYAIGKVNGLSTEEKLNILGEQAEFDVSAPGRRRAEAAGSESYGGRNTAGHSIGEVARRLSGCIYPAAAGGGRCLPVLKVLVSNVCRNDCRYCATRCSADVPRVSFHPEELARVFVEMERRGLVRGLFLSSGIAGTPDDGQALIVDTAHIVRRRYGYRGYLHLKILPGVSEAAVRATVELADRVSVNLEAPNEARLASLAPQKSLERELMPTLRLAIRHAQEAGLPSGVTTQYVAGAAGESDEELLRTSWRLYRELGVKRAYYSAFRPVPSSPLESVAAMPAIREHRLYQADWLLRHYGFEVDELVFESGGLLCLEADPKLVWARAHPESYPVDVATASYWELLRVPGIGPRSAKRLIEARNRAQPRDMKDLAAVGVQTSKARSFILINGRLPDGQMRLPI